MPATNSKPTPAELDQAKRLYNDINDYLEFLSETIQSEIQELSETEDSDDDDEEEFSPIVSQFLKEYKEYVASQPQIHAQLVSSDSNSSFTSNKSSRLPKRFWVYSKTYQTLQLLSPDLLSHKKLCDTELNCSVPVSPIFSSSFPVPDPSGNEKLLTNGTPSVALLKAQLEKNARNEEQEQEKNYLIIRRPTYTPVREQKFVFVVEKSTDVIVAPQTIEPPKQQEPIKEETKEKNSTIQDEKSELVEEVLSEKKVKKNTIDFDFLSNFLAITKVGFSRSQLRTLVWA